MKTIDRYIRRHPLDFAIHVAALVFAVTLAGFIHWPKTIAGQAAIAGTVALITFSATTSLIFSVLKKGKA